MDGQALYFPKTGSNINVKIKEMVLIFLEKNITFQEPSIVIF